MSKYLHSAQIAATYIGSIIGAGFASGQELLLFFSLYRGWGLWGLALATMLFGLLGAFVLVSSDRLGARSYADLLVAVVNPKFLLFFDLAAALMLMVGTGIMMVGSGVVGSEFLGLPHAGGVALMFLAVAVVAWGGRDRVKLANFVLIPALFFITAFLCIKVFSLPPSDPRLTVTTVPAGGNWLLASLLYVSYNMLAGFVVLSSIYRPGQKKANAWGGLLGGLGLGALAALVVFAELRMLPDASRYQAPMLYLASLTGSWGEISYAVVLWIAMFTTAIGNVLGLTQRLQQRFGLSPRVIVPVILAAVLPLMPFAFSDLIRYLYQFFGYLGLLLLGALFLAAFRGARKNGIF